MLSRADPRLSCKEKVARIQRETKGRVLLMFLSLLALVIIAMASGESKDFHFYVTIVLCDYCD